MAKIHGKRTTRQKTRVDLRQWAVNATLVLLALLVAIAAVHLLWFNHRTVRTHTSIIDKTLNSFTRHDKGQPTAIPYLRLFFRESPGYQERRQFTFLSQGEFRPGSLIHMGGGAPLKMSLEIEGSLLVTVTHSEEGTFAGYARCDDPLQITLHFNDETSGVLSRDLETKLATGFMFRGDRNGKVASLEFPKGFDEFSYSVAKSLLASFQLVVTEPLATSWQSEESDAIGLANTDYQFLTEENEPVIEKKKISYKKVYAQGAGPTTAKVTGATSFFIDKTEGVLSHIRGDEAVTTYLDNGEQIGTHRSEFSFKAAEREFLSDSALQSLENRLAAAFAGATLFSFDTPMPSSFDNDQIYRDELGDTSYAELMAELGQAGYAPSSSGKSRIDTYIKVKAFISLRSDELGQLAADLYPYDVSREAVNSWLRALAAVGNEGAQKTLLDMLAKVPSNNVEAKVAIINSLALLPRANASVEAAIRALMDHAANQEISRAAYLSLGIIGNRLNSAAGADGAPLSAEDKARVAKIYNDIRLKLEATKDVERQKLLLSVLGNLGSPMALGDLDALRSSANDSRVRASAVMALRLMPSDQAAPLLLDSLRGDASSEVKMAAIRALSYQEVSFSQLGDLKDLYGTTGDMTLKNQILQRIAKEKPRFEGFVTEFLQEVSRDPASGSLAPLADQLLGSGKH